MEQKEALDKRLQRELSNEISFSKILVDKVNEGTLSVSLTISVDIDERKYDSDHHHSDPNRKHLFGEHIDRLSFKIQESLVVLCERFI